SSLRPPDHALQKSATRKKGCYSPGSMYIQLSTKAKPGRHCTRSGLGQERKMRTLLRPAYAACFIVCGCLPMRGQVYPVPIPGGDIFKSAGGPTTFVTQFFPGLGGGFD